MQHHIDAWSSRNLEEIVSDYSDDSVVIMVNKVYRGKIEIRALFVNLFTTFDKAEEHQIDPAIVLGKIVYIPKHTHKKSEAHIILGGSHLFEHDGKRFEVKEHG